MFEELLHDADPFEDLHLLLHSPGGDGETAIRIARAAYRPAPISQAQLDRAI